MDINAKGKVGRLLAGYAVAATFHEWSLSASSNVEWAINATLDQQDNFVLDHYDGDIDVEVDVGKVKWRGATTVVKKDPLELKANGRMRTVGQGTI